MKTEPAAWDLHKGSRKTLWNGGNQGVDAGNDLSLRLSFGLEDLNQFCNGLKSDFN